MSAISALKDERGSTLVEFALLAPIFLGLLIATLEIGVLQMMSANFNNAVVSAGRHIRTGQADGTKNAKDFKDLICASMAGGGKDCKNRLWVRVERFSDFATAAAAGGEAASEADGGSKFDRGSAGDIMLVDATYRWPILTPFTGEAFKRTGAAEVQITSRMLFRNEPYE